VGLSLTFYRFLDQSVAREEDEAVERIRTRLRALRTRGHDEVALQEMVAEETGDEWTILAGRLFGSRALQAPWSLRRPGFLCSILQRLLDRRRDERHQRLLQEVEEKRLEAGGVNLLTARRKARRIARALAIVANEWRDEQQLLGSTERTATPAS